jgi:hypothetical protein
MTITDASLQVVDDGHALAIHAPHFEVDKSLGDIPAPLPRNAHFSVFCGPPRSGKTSLAVCMLTQRTPKLYAGVFDRVYFVIPQASFESLGDDSPFKAHKRVFHTLSPEFLTGLMAELEQNSRAKLNSLVLVDDFAAELKDTNLRKHLERLINNRRHIRTSIWICCQTLRGLPLSTRKLISHIFAFKSSNLQETESIRGEFAQIPKVEWNAFIRHVFPKGCDPHQFMMIDVAGNRFYNKFAEMSLTRFCVGDHSSPVEPPRLEKNPSSDTNAGD